MVIAGIHVGLHWSRVLLLTRISSPSRLRTLLLRGLAACVAAFGLWSWNILGVSGKLTFTYSLDFGDFTSSVAPFFGHWIGVVGLAAVVTYYMLRVAVASAACRAAEINSCSAFDLNRLRWLP